MMDYLFSTVSFIFKIFFTLYLDWSAQHLKDTRTEYFRFALALHKVYVCPFLISVKSVVDVLYSKVYFIYELLDPAEIRRTLGGPCALKNEQNFKFQISLESH